MSANDRVTLREGGEQIGRAQVLQHIIVEMMLNFPMEFEAGLTAARRELED